MPSLKEVAAKCKVSIATVSYVYNDKWREKGISEKLAERVAKVIKDCGYHPNAMGRQLRQAKSWTVGGLLPDLARYYNLDLLAGIEKELARAGYYLLLANSDFGRDEETHLQHFQQRHVDGIIFCPQLSGEKRRLPVALQEGKIPVVQVDNYSPETGWDYVVSDNRQGARDAVEYLLARGRRRVAFLGASTRLPVVADRLAGYEDALKAAGIAPAPELIFTEVTDDRALIEALVATRARGADGIFAGSLLYFAPGLRWLLEQGVRIPEDIGLIGFDRLESGTLEQEKLSASWSSLLPYVEQDALEIGSQAARRLLSLLGGEESGTCQILVPPRLYLPKDV
jgi:DNA-binding LacI/PurR family transcriptional regulator